MTTLEDDDLPFLPESEPAATKSVAPPPEDDDDGDDLAVFGQAIQAETEMLHLERPWMKYHEFHLVKTVDEVREIVDKALAHGRCSLDLETEGFDNRIDYDQ